MLSKNTTFSLTSLITIFALALTVSTAEAADDFDATLSVVRVSTASDHNAVYGEDIEVTLTFGAQVDGTEATLTIFVEDKFGAQTEVTLATDSIKPKDLNATTVDVVENNNKVFVFTIPAANTNADDVKVHMLVAAAVAEIVPVGSLKTSKEGKLTIDLVGPDADGPEVLSIALAPGVIVPAAGYTGATIDVIITLSEAPKAFTAADHLNITDTATAADPVALDPVAEQTASELQTQFQRAGVGNPPRMRGLYNVAGAVPPFVNPVRTDDPPLSAEQLAVRMTHGGIHRAINDVAHLRSDDSYTYVVIDPSTGEAIVPENLGAANATFIGGLATTAPAAGATDNSIPTEPSKTLTESATHPKTVTVSDGGYTFNDAGNGIDFPAGTDRTVKPTQPDPSAFTTNIDYTNGLALFNARRSLHAEYMTEKNEYDAYTAAVADEEAVDETNRDNYYAEFGQEVARGTGYDSMLHPYLVTITPKYANKNAVVVKVKEWEEQSIPDPGSSARKYPPPPTEAEYTEGKLTN